MNLTLRRLPALAAIAALSIGLLAPSAHATTILTAPPGLSAGQQYRILFVTSTGHAATSADLATYDSFVNGAANAGGSLLQPLNQTWTAIGSTFTYGQGHGVPGDSIPADASDPTSAYNHIGGTSSLQIYLLDGTLIATSSADLWDNSIAHAINLTETGNTTSSGSVWTGTQANGSEDPFPLGASQVTYGNIGASNVTWTQFNFRDHAPSESLPFYGISGPISAVPEPGSITLLAVGGLTGLFLLRRKWAARQAAA